MNKVKYLNQIKIFFKTLNFKKVKKFWNWTWNSSSISSYFVSFLLSFIIIKFLIFPTLNVSFNNEIPISIVVSGSMEHKIVNGKICTSYGGNQNKDLNVDEWWDKCNKYYLDYGITKQNFTNFHFTNGLNIGDILLISGWKNKKEYNVGDVVAFYPQDLVNVKLETLEFNKSFFYQTKGPVIHRVIKKFEKNGEIFYQTKGDHNANSNKGYSVGYRDNKKSQYLKFNDFELNIPSKDIIGSPIFKVPYIGYIKIFFFNF